MANSISETERKKEIPPPNTRESNSNKKNSDKGLNCMLIIGIFISILLVIVGIFTIPSTPAKGVKAVDGNNVKEIKLTTPNCKIEIKEEPEQSLYKKIKLANTFFKYILALIMAISGIIGILLIFIWYGKNHREKKEEKERDKIRDWELIKIFLNDSKVIEFILKKINQ